MERKSFLKQFRFILPIGLAILLISSPTSAEDIYSVVPGVTPSYIEAEDLLPALKGDELYLEVPLPFSFTFYKVGYSRAYVSTNGFLSFIQGSYSYRNTVLPNIAIPNGAIYAFWDDLLVDVNNGASVRKQLLGTEPNRRFVIEWRNVTFSNNNSKRIDFEIVLHENGVILLQYRNIANDLQERGISATVGVEDEKGNRAIQVSPISPNQAPIGVGEYAIRFAHLAKSVPVDIRPMACPNPLNVGSQGVLPVAILGTSDLDVTAIDPSSLRLSGGSVILPTQEEDPLKIKKKIKVLVSNLSPKRWSLEDVGTPYAGETGAFAGKIDPYQCNDLGPDGQLDLLLKFDTQEIVATLNDVEDKGVVTLQLSGKLKDGTTEIRGEDVVIIRGKERKNK